MSNNLAPCPFCGKDPEVRYRQETWSTGFLVVCLSCECSDRPAEWETPREAIRDWNQHWANGLISNTLELNQQLTNECLRLRRENEKYRRKTLKRWWLRTSRQYDEFTCTVFDTWLDAWYALNMRFKVAHTRKRLRDDLDAERRRNPELLRFLKWQDNFCSK